MSEPKATMDIHTGRVNIPMPPPPTAAQNVAPTPAAAPAPAPVAQTPAPAAAAPAPAQAPAPTVNLDAIVQAKVDGRTFDVPVKDLIAQYQMRSAAEKRLTDANRLQNERAAQVQLGEFIERNARTNPDAVMAKLRELGLSGGGATPTDANEDVSPETRELRTRLAQLEAQGQALNQYLARQQTDAKVNEIRAELSKYPLYQGSPEAMQQAEIVVAAYLVREPGSNVGDIASELHAKQAEMVRQHLTNERDNRAANVQNMASVPPSAGTPSMTEQTIPKPTGAQLRDGSWKKSFDENFAKLLRGT